VTHPLLIGMRELTYDRSPGMMTWLGFCVLLGLLLAAYLKWVEWRRSRPIIVLPERIVLQPDTDLDLELWDLEDHIEEEAGEDTDRQS
jgi:hypothetical protein